VEDEHTMNCTRACHLFRKSFSFSHLQFPAT